MSNYDDLSAWEVSEAEKTSGMSAGSIGDDKAPKLGLLGALAWQHVRRGEPDLTFEAYMRRIKPNEPMTYLFGSDEDELTPEAEAAGFPDTAEPGQAAGGGEGELLPGDQGPAE